MAGSGGFGSKKRFNALLPEAAAMKPTAVQRHDREGGQIALPEGVFQVVATCAVARRFDRCRFGLTPGAKAEVNYHGDCAERATASGISNWFIAYALTRPGKLYQSKLENPGVNATVLPTSAIGYRLRLSDRAAPRVRRRGGMALPGLKANNYQYSLALRAGICRHPEADRSNL